MARIIGAKAHQNRLRRMHGPTAIKKVGAALFAAGHLIQVEAQASITRGAVSGKGHVASKPGEPPKQDTGVLANNIETNQVGRLKVEVSSNAPYAVPLERGSEREAGVGFRSFSSESKKQGPIRTEYGDSKTEARPYMAPAAAKKKREAVQLVRRAVDSVVRGG